VKIGVLMKQVPDSETRIKIKADGSGIETADIKWIMNPYDEYAVEEALKTLTKFKGEVVIFTVGPKKAEEAIRNGLAMGATRGVRIDNAGAEDGDTLGIARLLAGAVKAEGINLLFAGKQAIDNDNSATPQMVAELLDWPHVTFASSFEASDESSVTVGRSIGGGAREMIKTSLPAVVSCDKGLNTPRYASLPGIMKAKRKKIDVTSATDLGVSAPLVKVTGYSLPPARQAGKVLSGELSEAVPQLVTLLHEEAKVI